MPSRTGSRLVHITLDPCVLADGARLDQIIQQIAASGVVPQNAKRIARYGIITGMMNSKQEKALKAVGGVLAVEEDSRQSIRE